jgi:hypothetical protein
VAVIPWSFSLTIAEKNLWLGDFYPLISDFPVDSLFCIVEVQETYLDMF